jgi:CRP-like cAMP-binding protein
MDCLEVRFYNAGDYLFKKGDKADYAYVVLYGTIILLNLK